MPMIHLTEQEARDLYAITMTGDAEVQRPTASERVAVRRSLRSKILDAVNGLNMAPCVGCQQDIECSPASDLCMDCYLDIDDDDDDDDASA